MQMFHSWWKKAHRAGASPELVARDGEEIAKNSFQMTSIQCPGDERAKWCQDYGPIWVISSLWACWQLSVLKVKVGVE